MNKQEKSQEIERLNEAFKAGPVTILVEQLGLTVNEVSELRKQIRASSATYRVIKNRLALRAVKKTPLEGLSEFLKGPSAIAYGGGDPAALAKAIQDFAKQHKGLQVKGGFVDGSIVDVEAVRTLADLPPRPVLVARLLGVLTAPMTRLLSVMNGTARDLVSVVNQIAKKKETGGASPAETPPES